MVPSSTRCRKARAEMRHTRAKFLQLHDMDRTATGVATQQEQWQQQQDLQRNPMPQAETARLAAVCMATTRAQARKDQAPLVKPSTVLPEVLEKPKQIVPATPQQEAEAAPPTDTPKAMDIDLAQANAPPAPGFDLHDLNLEEWRQASASCPCRLGTATPKILRVHKNDKLFVKDGLYWLQGPGLSMRLYVPQQVRQSVLKAYHDSPLGGHQGFYKTVQAIRERFWWPGYRAAIQAYCEECVSCQRNKPVRRKPLGLSCPTELPAQAWKYVTMDQVTALPLTARGHDAVLVMVDRFSKMVHVAPCRKDSDVQDILQLFQDYVIRQHGMPEKVLTDRGTQFNNTLTNELWRHLGVRQALSSAFHPQTDGQTERANQSVEELLRHYTRAEQDKWDDYLFLVEFALNSHVNKATGFSPFQLVMGYNPASPFDRVLKVDKASLARKGIADASAEDKAEMPKNQLVREHMDYMQQAWKAAKDQLLATAAKMEQRTNLGRRPHSYKVGDWVWLATTNLRMAGVNNKLKPRWAGPFRIESLVGPEGRQQAVKLLLPKGSRVHNVFHVQLTRPYKGPVQRNTEGQLVPLTTDDPVWVEGDAEYFVEKVLRHRVLGRTRNPKRSFLVKWLGFGDEFNTWEPEANLTLDFRVGNSKLDEYLEKEGLASTVLTDTGDSIATFHVLQGS